MDSQKQGVMRVWDRSTKMGGHTAEGELLTRVRSKCDRSMEGQSAQLAGDRVQRWNYQASGMEMDGGL